MRKILSSVALCIAAFLHANDSTLNLTFDQPQQVIVAGQPIDFKGEIKDAMLVLGEKGYTIPAQSLVGEQGTILAQLAIDKHDPARRGARHMLTLRTKSRLFVAIYNLADLKCLFAFSDQNKNVYVSSPSPMKPGEKFYAAISWDGNHIRTYLNGELLQERAQEVPVSAVTNLHIGPYKDPWYIVAPWGDENRIGKLKAWNRALTPAEIQKQSGMDSKPIIDTLPAKLVIPKAPAKPLIDGKLDDPAWRQAGSLVGMVDLRGDPLKGWRLPHNTYKYLWDDENLYLGFTALFPSNSEIRMGSDRKSGSSNEEAWGFESFEFRVLSGDAYYRFGGNVAGGSCSSKRYDSTWNEDWEYKSVLTHQIDDRKLWVGEVAIPWKSIGFSAAPKDEFSINFSRSWMLATVSCWCSSSWNGDYTKPEGFQKILCKDVPAMQIIEQGSPEFASLSQKVLFSSPKDTKLLYEVFGATRDGTITPRKLFSQEFAVSAGQSREQDLTIPIRQSIYDSLIFELKEKDQVLMRQMLPFKLNEELFSLSPRFFQNKLQTNVIHFMVKEKFPGEAPYSFVLKNSLGEVVHSQAVGDEDAVTVPFDNRNSAGNYTLQLQGKSGKALYERTFHFPGIGEWANMTFDNRIIPPFTPLQVESGNQAFTASMYARSYQWKNTLFPAAVFSKNEALLAAPVRLTVNGKDSTVASVKLGKVADHRMEFNARHDSEECTVVNEGWIEYDGVSYYTVKFTAKKPVKTMQLTIDMPAKLCKYIHASSNAPSWGAKITDKVSDGERQLQFFPMVWLGMEDKGLCFFTETRKGWKNSPVQVYSLKKGADLASFEVSMAADIAAGEELELEFGIIATPVRPLPENYPCNLYTWSWNIAMNRVENPVIDLVLGPAPGNKLGHSFGDLPGAGSEAAIKTVQKQIDLARKYKVRYVPYNIDRYLSDEYPEMAAFKDEWKIAPDYTLDYDTEQGKAFLYDCCPRTQANNFFMYRFKKMLENLDLDGIYLDFGIVPTCSNHEHGCDGGIPYLAQREFYRRLCLVQLDAGIKDPVILLHNTDSVQVPAMTFATHLFNGEHIRQQSSSIMHDGKDILDTYGIEMFASELGSLPFGLTNADYQSNDVLHDRFGGGKEDPELYKFRITKAFLTGALPHNTMPSASRCHHGIFDKLIRIYNAFGVPKAEFVGYWKNPAKVLKGKDIYVSVYKHKQLPKALAVISHISKEHVKQNLEIVFDESLGKFSKATDCMLKPDPDYLWLEEQRAKAGVPTSRAPLKLGDFGSNIQSFANGLLKMELDYHSFAIVELE
jgi:hypothetical protein